MKKMTRIEEATLRANQHSEQDLGTTKAFFFPKAHKTDVCLLEVSSSAPTSNDAFPFVYGPGDDVDTDRRLQVILLSTEEYEKVKRKHMKLPAKWNLKEAIQIMGETYVICSGSMKCTRQCEHKTKHQFTEHVCDSACPYSKSGGVAGAICVKYDDKTKYRSDSELLDWLEKQDGAALISDDAGHWAVSGTGMQTVPVNPPDDVETGFFIEKEQWKKTIREAIRVYIEEIES